MNLYDVLINTLNRMMASSGLSRNGRFDGAGMGPGPMGFAATGTDDRGVSGERREVEHA